jgi:uncharacterized protein
MDDSTHANGDSHVRHDENGMTSNGHGHGHDHDIHLDKHMSRDDALRRVRTAGSISISPELFEKLYLTPETKVKGELRKTFGNPTPM